MSVTKVFVGSLPSGSRPEELRRLFENYGVVVECDIMNRCGFVHMGTPDMASKAISSLHNTQFKGQSIVVEAGRPKGKGKSIRHDDRYANNRTNNIGSIGGGYRGRGGSTLDCRDMGGTDRTYRERYAHGYRGHFYGATDRSDCETYADSYSGPMRNEKLRSQQRIAPYMTSSRNYANAKYDAGGYVEEEYMSRDPYAWSRDSSKFRMAGGGYSGTGYGGDQHYKEWDNNEYGSSTVGSTAAVYSAAGHSTNAYNAAIGQDTTGYSTAVNSTAGYSSAGYSTAGYSTDGYGYGKDASGYFRSHSQSYAARSQSHDRRGFALPDNGQTDNDEARKHEAYGGSSGDHHSTGFAQDRGGYFEDFTRGSASSRGAGYDAAAYHSGMQNTSWDYYHDSGQETNDAGRSMSTISSNFDEDFPPLGNDPTSAFSRDAQRLKMTMNRRY